MQSYSESWEMISRRSTKRVLKEEGECSEELLEELSEELSEEWEEVSEAIVEVLREIGGREGIVRTD